MSEHDPRVAPADEPLPLAPPDVSRTFPPQAAKFSLYAGLLALFINLGVMQGGRDMSTAGRVAVSLLCGVFVLAGVTMALTALSQNRRFRLPGVRGYAAAGIVFGGLALLLTLARLVAMIVS